MLLSLASAEETEICQFMTECVVPVKTLEVAHYSLGNTRSGQKVAELSFEGAVRRHCPAQGRTVEQHFF